jgi:hypothetical protein
MDDDSSIDWLVIVSSPSSSSDGSSARLHLVKEFPSVRTVELSYPDRGDQGWVEIPEMNTLFGARLRLQWFPVRHATAGPTADCF